VGAHQLSVVGQTQHGEELDRQQQTVQDVNADQHLDERQTGHQGDAGAQHDETGEHPHEDRCFRPGTRDTALDPQRLAHQ